MSSVSVTRHWGHIVVALLPAALLTFLAGTVAAQDTQGPRPIALSGHSGNGNSTDSTVVSLQGIAMPLEASPDTDFVYRLPYGAKKTARAVQRSAIEARHYHEDNLVGFKCWEFVFKAKEDVYAVRKGIVRIHNNSYVEVLHSDGSAARYSLMTDVKVQPGDTVTPDMVIGTSGTDESGNNAVEIELYYCTRKSSAQSRTQASYLRRYINPRFATTKGKTRLKPEKEYRAKVNDKLINKEN